MALEFTSEPRLTESVSDKPYFLIELDPENLGTGSISTNGIFNSDDLQLESVLRSLIAGLVSQL